MSKILKIIGTRWESPVRCCDIGGWLDTWFAVYGSVVNLSVFTRLFGSSGPFRGVEVLIGYGKPDFGNGTIYVCAADPTYDITIKVDDLLSGNFDHKNLLLDVLYLIEQHHPFKKDLYFRINSIIQPGASLGTSASVVVASIKAAINDRLSDAEIAKLAWRAETDPELMDGQSGTQDQYAATYPGAVKRIDVTEFPKTQCHEIVISDKTRTNLNNGLVTIFYGKHDSSDTHKKVIKHLEKTGPQAIELQPFRPLADLAERALTTGDLPAYGDVMKANTEAQRQLCEGLVSKKADAIIKLGSICNALGWKVNGAGGAGGSITLLFSSRKESEQFYDYCKAIHQPENGYVYYEHELI